jgi:hypothetical protein
MDETLLPLEFTEQGEEGLLWFLRLSATTAKRNEKLSARLCPANTPTDAARRSTSKGRVKNQTARFRLTV